MTCRASWLRCEDYSTGDRRLAVAGSQRCHPFSRSAGFSIRCQDGPAMQKVSMTAKANRL